MHVIQTTMRIHSKFSFSNTIIKMCKLKLTAVDFCDVTESSYAVDGSAGIRQRRWFSGY